MQVCIDGWIYVYMFNLLRGNACMKHTRAHTYTHSTCQRRHKEVKSQLLPTQHEEIIKPSLPVGFPSALHLLTYFSDQRLSCISDKTDKQTDREKDTNTQTHTLTHTILTFHKQDNHDKLLCILFLWHTSIPLPHISLTPPKILKTSQRSKVFCSALTKIKIKVSKCTYTYTHHSRHYLSVCSALR